MMKKVLLSIFLTLLPLLAYSTIEGIYQVQPESYRISSQTTTYGKPFEIMILNNGDGTYYVDDLFGGWYSQRSGYGKNYNMTGNIEISEDGTVSLKDSFIEGWGDGLKSLTGTYDATNSTFRIECGYSNLYFVQTWVKVDDVYTGEDTNIEKDGIYYKLNSHEKKAAVAFNPLLYKGDLVIPEKIEHDGIEYNVTAITDSAFYLCKKLLSLEIPNSITTIGSSSFNGCESLASITIPNSVTGIGDCAFYGCKNLASVVFSNHLKRIGNNVFYECSSFNTVEIPDGVTSIGDGAFYGCRISSLSLPGSIKEIGNQAFAQNLLTELDIPYGVAIIGDRAFESSYYLTTVNFPSTIVSIGYSVFDLYYELSSINISDLSAWCNADIKSELFTNGVHLYLNGSEIRELVIPNDVKRVKKHNFVGCPSIVSVTIPNSVTEVADSAFLYCTNLQSISFQCHIDSIGKYTFGTCSSLESVTIPDDVELIGDGAFYECGKLKSISLPIKLKSIGKNAFYNCKDILELNIPESVTTIGDGAFSGCEGLKNLKIPASITSIGSGAFSGCNGLTSITVDNGNMAYDSRFNCNAIIETASNKLIIGCKTTTIPVSIVIIGSSAFYNCKDLKTINIPNTVSMIESYAFSGSGLESIEIPKTVKDISRAFNGCTKLTSLNIPESISLIYDGAFSNSGLRSISIPESVKVIHQYAFDNCRELKDVFCFAKDVPEKNSPFSYYPIEENATLHVPESSIEKYKSAKFWSDFGIIIALTEEELSIYGDDNPEIELSNSIEGIYMIQPDSYCLNNGNKGIYGNSYEIIIVDNGDGSYYVDDLLGGWYSQVYGPNYFMTGNIEITTNGFVSLKDSYVKGWGNSLVGLTGSYNSEKKTFSIEAEYVEGMKFYQNWVKVGDIFTVDGITYGITGNNTVSVWRGKEPYSGNINIPEKVSNNGETYTVTSLGIAFNECESLKSLTIPNSIKSISGAFNGCTALKSVNIPNIVTIIEKYDFLNCTSLETVDIPNSVTTIGREAFADCVNLSDLTLSDGIITIGNGAFSYINLKSLTIPKSVLHIGDIAFSSVGALESIRVDEKNAKYDSRGNCNAIIETYTNRMILGCKNTVIPQDVTIIGRGAFSGCNDLVTMDIPSSVTSIENGAFGRCKNIKTITVGEKVVFIERFAFSGCENLNSIVIPSTIKTIEMLSFAYCNNLRDVFCYAEAVPTTHSDAFLDVPIVNATLHVPAASVEAYRTTTPWSGFGKIVALTDNDPKPTSVNSLKTEEKATPVATYSIDGRRLSQPQRGLNIIRMSDGTTKKVMIK